MFFTKNLCFLEKKQENRDAFFDFRQRYMAETNRDAEMQIGGRNGANKTCRLHEKTGKKSHLLAFASPKAVLFGKIL